MFSIISLVVIFLSVSLAKKCPPVSEIYPCKCYEEYEEVGCTDLRVQSLKSIFENVNQSQRRTKLRRLFIDSTDVRQLESNFSGGFEFAEVSIVDNKCLQTVHCKAFDNLNVNIEDLRIVGSNISGNEKCLFAAVSRMSNLKRLLLFDNNLQKVSLFGRQSQLYLIELNDNQVTTIEDNAFSHLSYLQAVSLSGNRLTEITNYTFAFKDISTIPLTIDLSRNNLSDNSFSYGSFSYSTTKRPIRLFLSQNPISKLNEKIFKPLLDGHAESEIHFNHYPFGDEVKYFDCSNSEQWIIENRNEYSKRIFGFKCS